MFLLTVIVSIVLPGCLLFLFWAGSRLRGKFRQPPHQSADQPPAAVILCVRGADPSLELCLKGLTEQDYPDYSIHIVVDQPTDPAEAIVRRFAESDHRIEVHFLDQPPRHRGLKVSGILQAISQLDQRVERVAWIDADAVAPSTWLRDLVAPLDDESIGATTGSRWFQPRGNAFGGQIRAEWNMYAVTMMHLCGIPWGGSFAMRRSNLEKAGVIDIWDNKICEDTCLDRAMSAAGLRVELVPSVSLINRENCTIGGAFRFVARQLTFARLHSGNWPVVCGASLIYSLFSIAAPALVVLQLLLGEWQDLSIMLPVTILCYAAIVLFELSIRQLPGLLRQQHSSRPTSGQPGEIENGSAAALLRAPVRTYISQVACAIVTTVACLVAMTNTAMTWRGIRYRIGSGSSITMEEWRPFAAEVPESHTAPVQSVATVSID